jgi:hypothetical protein
MKWWPPGWRRNGWRGLGHLGWSLLIGGSNHGKASGGEGVWGHVEAIDAIGLWFWGSQLVASALGSRIWNPRWLQWQAVLRGTGHGAHVMVQTAPAGDGAGCAVGRCGALAGARAQQLGADGKCTGDRGNLPGWAVALCWREAEKAGRGMTFGPQLAVTGKKRSGSCRDMGRKVGLQLGRLCGAAWHPRLVGPAQGEWAGCSCG